MSVDANVLKFWSFFTGTNYYNIELYCIRKFGILCPFKQLGHH